MNIQFFTFILGSFIFLVYLYLVDLMTATIVSSDTNWYAYFHCILIYSIILRCSFITIFSPLNSTESSSLYCDIKKKNDPVIFYFDGNFRCVFHKCCFTSKYLSSTCLSSANILPCRVSTASQRKAGHVSAVILTLYYRNKTT